jgi:hypothetical protein
MTELHARTWLLLGALAVPAHVFAQPALISREPYRKWDVDGVFEINWGESAGWSADLGRYWSPHLKTSLAISTPDEGYHGVPDVPSLALRCVIGRRDRCLAADAPDRPDGHGAQCRHRRPREAGRGADRSPPPAIEAIVTARSAALHRRSHRL